MNRSQTHALLIVNADDLGRSPGINRGIFTAHREGIVTSATLMVGFDAAAEAAAALADHPALGVGLHLTLSGAPPTLPVDRVPHLVDRDGLLPRRPERAEGPLASEPVPPATKSGGDPGLRPTPGTGPALDRHQEKEAWREVRATQAEVLAEVRHQLERFRHLTGRLPTHLDTHHHSHRILPLVLEAVIAVALEHGLPVRNASPAVGRRLRREGIPTTDRFVESFFGERTGSDDLLNLLGEGHGPDDAQGEAHGASTELMCHPARVDQELTAASTYTVERERELATLTDPAVRRAVEEAGWRLGHFGHLPAAPPDRAARPEGGQRR